MTLKAKTRFYKLKKDLYALYIPKAMSEDSQWPFKDMKAEVEIIVMPSKIQGLGKLFVKTTPKINGGEKP